MNAPPRLIIDGYNLLYAIGFGQIGSPAANLLLARQELLGFLQRCLPADERRSTVVVFDAKRAPYGADATLDVAGMSVRFAVDYLDADELIKELIRGHTAPSTLLVVSSDHSIQVAAQRRRAQAIDSEAWYERNRSPRVETAPESPSSPVDNSADFVEQRTEDPTRRAGRTRRRADRDAPRASKPEGSRNQESPFPPDYAQEVLREADDASPFPPGYGEDIREHDLDLPPPRGRGRRRR